MSDGTPAVPTSIPGGTYNSTTATGTGNAILASNVTVSSFVLFNGVLSDGCSVISGESSFTLVDGATLNIYHVAGASGAMGAVQTTGPRSFSSDAFYLYDGTDFDSQFTGTDLPAIVRNLTSANNVG